MKLKYYFLFFVLSLLASCNDEEGLDLHNKPIESNSIVLSPDEYISIAYDNPRVITPDEAKQLALRFRTEIKEIPLVYVGGLVSREKIDEVLDDGFEFVQMGRALLNEPGFVNRLRTEEKARCNCGHSNYCIARMYTIDMACHKHLEEKLPLCLEREIEKLENQ